MSDSDLATLLREHRMIPNGDPNRRFYCPCHKWETETVGTLHAYDEFVVHLASVLSGVYAITPLPVVSISGGNCDPLVAVREVLQSWDDGDYDAEGDFAPHHVVRHLRQALGDVS